MITFEHNYSLNDINRKYASYYTEEVDKFIEFLNIYHSSFVSGQDNFYLDFCNKNNFSYHHYDDIDFPMFSINDGYFARYIRLPFSDNVSDYDEKFGEYLSIAIERIKLAQKKMKEFSPKYDLAFLIHWEYMVNSWLYIVLAVSEKFNAVKAKYENNEKDISIHLTKAIEYLEKINKLREELPSTMWDGWFIGDRKTGINNLIRVLNITKKEFTNSNLK